MKLAQLDEFDFVVTLVSILLTLQGGSKDRNEISNKYHPHMPSKLRQRQRQGNARGCMWAHPIYTQLLTVGSAQELSYPVSNCDRHKECHFMFREAKYTTLVWFFINMSSENL